MTASVLRILARGAWAAAWLSMLAFATGAAFTSASAADSQTLVSWRGASAPEDPSWLPLHGFDGSVLGLLSANSRALTSASASDLGAFDEEAPFFLIPRASYETLREGALPSGWSSTLARLAAEDGASDATPERYRAPDPAELRAIEALAGDDAHVLIRLPQALSWVADEPGCRVQRWRARPPIARGAPSEADENSTALLREELDPQQPAEYWQALADAVNTGRTYADLDYLSTTLMTRHAYTNQMSLACAYVMDEFLALGLQTSYDTFTYSGRTLKNVLGIKRGMLYPYRIYIICGHLDSTSQTPTTNAPGAEDNGTGSAAVLEAARLLAHIPTSCTIYFLCLTAEEQGLIGSEHFANLADQQNLDIRGVLNLDMAGYYQAGGSDLWLEGFRYGTPSTWLMDMMEANAESYTDLVVYRYPGEGWGSDHEPFHDHGFPAMLSIDYDWEDYPCYHRSCDIVSRLNGNLWRQIIAANAITLGQLAGLQGATGWVEGEVASIAYGTPDGATLRLVGTNYSIQTSAADGSFGWPTLFPGSYTLIGEKSGYLPDTTEVSVVSGAPAQVTLTLIPEGLSDVDEAHSRSSSIALTISPTPVLANASLRLDLPKACDGALCIFTADGRKLAQLYAGLLSAGSHAFSWNGRDDAGLPAPAGVYWVRWVGEAPAEQASRRLLIVR
ncbi:MAG: M28 family peptidase [Candidatus Eisenbacteria bacterium]|nr:M28 family peptidase [Candidatus Eisenbacteria bacterium]